MLRIPQPSSLSPRSRTGIGRVLGLVVALIALGSPAQPVHGKPFIVSYGTRVQFFLGQPIQYPDLEITFDGGGSATDASGASREYRAFRVWSKGKSILVTWYAGKPGEARSPVSFQIVGQRYTFQVFESSNPRADGALAVWKSR